MKRLTFFLLLSLSALLILAQEKDKVRVGGNIGLTFPPNGVGGEISFWDIRFNIRDNLNVGVKFGGAIMIRNFSGINESESEKITHFNSAFMMVSDYYLNNGTSAFAPFIGGGIGLFDITDLYKQADSADHFELQLDDLPETHFVFGGAVRTGFEYGKCRIAVEYYILPETPKYNVADIIHSVGKSGNSYFSVNFGFYFGGGKWEKQLSKN